MHAFGYQRTVRSYKDRYSFGNLELWFRAALAQLVEHIIRNDGVSSSSLLSGTRFYEKIKRLLPTLSYFSKGALSWNHFGTKRVKHHLSEKLIRSNFAFSIDCFINMNKMRASMTIDANSDALGSECVCF